MVATRVEHMLWNGWLGFSALIRKHGASEPEAQPRLIEAGWGQEQAKSRLAW